MRLTLTLIFITVNSINSNQGLNIESCPQGYFKVIDKCYMFISEPTEHSEAQSYCRNNEGKLAEPESKVQVELLVELFGDEKSFWVGVSDKKGQGR